MRALNSPKRFKTETGLLVLSTTFIREIPFYKEKWNNKTLLKHKNQDSGSQGSSAIFVFFGMINFAGNSKQYVSHLFTVNKYKMHPTGRKGEKSKSFQIQCISWSQWVKILA